MAKAALAQRYRQLSYHQWLTRMHRNVSEHFKVIPVQVFYTAIGDFY